MISKRGHFLPKNIVDLQFHFRDFGQIKLNLGDRVEGIGIILVESVDHGNGHARQVNINLVKVERPNVRNRCVGIKRQVWIARINARRASSQMKVVAGHELWIQEDVVVGIARIPIGIDGVELANLGRALGGIIIVEGEIAPAVAKEVAVGHSAGGAVLKVDPVAFGKGNNSGIEPRRGIEAINPAPISGSDIPA